MSSTHRRLVSTMTETALTLSVLDLVPVRSDQSTSDALRATLDLARTADGLGYRRYWLAEHHNMPAVAATNPPVLIRAGSTWASAGLPAPGARTVPTIWLLGSSDYSARLAAEKGMPYVFAHHFSGKGTAEALELYRSQFRPSPELPGPRTFLTVNASVAESSEEARRLALPQLQMMLALGSGQPLTAQHLVEEAEKRDLPAEQAGLMDAMAARWVIGDPASAREQLATLAATYDEVMVNPVGGAYVGTEPGASPTREETLRLLVG